MITILVMWRERGYLRKSFWSTESCPADQAIVTARRMIAEARRTGRIFGVRAKVGGL